MAVLTDGWNALKNALRVPELRHKLYFTLSILLLYLFATHVPLPGFSLTELDEIRAGKKDNQVFQTANLFTGGALANASVVALSIFPYITATKLLEAMYRLFPRIEARYREPGGHEKWPRDALSVSIPVAILSAWVGNEAILPTLGISTSPLLTRLAVIVTLTGGAVWCWWLSNLITEYGIGNGMTLILLTAITSQIPAYFSGLYDLFQKSPLWSHIPAVGMAFLVVFMAILLFPMIMLQQGFRRIAIQSGKRVRTRRYGGGSTWIPIRVMRGAYEEPIEFAGSILLIVFFLLDIVNLDGPRSALAHFWALAFFALAFSSTYFNGWIEAQTDETAELLQNHSWFIPGIRPGLRTEAYIKKITLSHVVLTTLVFAILSILPQILQAVFQLDEPVLMVWALWVLPIYIIDHVRLLEDQLMSRNYMAITR